MFRRFPALALAGASGLAYAAGPALEATTKQATNWSAIVMFMIFVGLTMVGVPQDLQYLIKGAIILFACALDMRKYLVKK